MKQGNALRLTVLVRTIGQKRYQAHVEREDDPGKYARKREDEVDDLSSISQLHPISHVLCWRSIRRGWMARVMLRGLTKSTENSILDCHAWYLSRGIRYQRTSFLQTTSTPRFCSMCTPRGAWMKLTARNRFPSPKPATRLLPRVGVTGTPTQPLPPSSTPY